MTDPLLTIEEATREFRVSPKTIRRRLTSGEIPGAYKRPGNRGPEWVIPRRSLADAGFRLRVQTPPAELPVAAEDRASYWEQRATDAEAALRSAGDPVEEKVRTRDRRGLGWALVAISIVVGVVAGLLLVPIDRADDVETEPTASATMVEVAAFLDQRTDQGDAVGVVGEHRPEAIPAGREIASTPGSGWDSPGGPRFVVAIFDEATPTEAVRTLRASADVVMRIPHAGRLVEVYDRAPVPDVAPAEEAPLAAGGEALPSPGPAAEPAPDDPVEPPGSTAAPTTTAVPGGDDVAPAEPAVTVPPSPESEAPSAAPGTTVQVAPGESFWTIAEQAVATELGAEPSLDAVTAYWSALMSANADRLVVPGNADLLHVGQTIVLPPLM